MDTDTDENETATTVDDSLDEDTPDGEDGYYDNPDDVDCVSSTAADPEAFKFEILRMSEVDKLLSEQVQQISEATGVQPAVAKVLLKHFHWQTAEVIDRMHNDATRTLIEARVEPKAGLGATQSLATALNNNNTPSAHLANATSSRHTHSYGLRSKKASGDEASSSASLLTTGSSTRCGVCFSTDEPLRGLRCGHRYCASCWEMHFGVKLERGVASGLECMHSNCDLICPEDFVLAVLTRSSARERYITLCVRDYVESHPRLRYCPGANCDAVALAPDPLARRVVCTRCTTSFCFRCGSEYHAPTDCATIQKWLKKCRDDSETYNYICANTKDCPACHVCIEKNGGCNHMMCSKCRHEFCWICLGDWKNHGTEYYECSRYRGKEHGDSNSASATAREALTKYLFYYTRWDNHGNSLKLEAQFLRKIRERIDEKVSKQEGTWIDWQPLINAAELLQRSRYTLRYTYPYAYYLERGSTKELFEMRQAQLEREVEELAWKIEHAEITDRGDLQNQMNITEKRRLTLLTDFLQK